MLTLLKRSAALLLVSSTFLSTASFVHAETFVLPQEFQHPGLTFSQSLHFDSPKKLAVHSSTIQFSLSKKLSLKDEKKQAQLENIVLAPTLEPKVPTPIPTEEVSATQTPTLLPAQPTTKPYTPNPNTTVAVPTPTAAPAVTQTAATTTGGLSGDKLFSMSNAYRQSKGLAPFEKDERACTLAASRAPEINGEIAAGTMHSGLRARALPYWNTENIISMNSEDAAFNWWVNDPIHHDAIVGSYKYSCVACSGNACAQEFTNFQAK
jgi:uncharacterized protein YkwD